MVCSFSQRRKYSSQSEKRDCTVTTPAVMEPGHQEDNSSWSWLDVFLLRAKPKTVGRFLGLIWIIILAFGLFYIAYSLLSPIHATYPVLFAVIAFFIRYLERQKQARRTT